MQEDVIFREGNRTLTAEICCEIDHHTARRMREVIDKELFIRRPEILTLDFSSVGFMDSSGMGLVLGRCAVAEQIGCSVRLVGLSERLLRLVRLCGVERIKNLSVME